MDSTNTKGKARSRLRPSRNYLYLIFDRNDDDPIKIFIAKYPKTVAVSLTKLERTPDPQDQDVLLHGPTFCWDAVITHSVDKSSKGTTWQQHGYDVQPYSKTNKFAGQIPTEIWKHTNSPWGNVSDESKHIMFTDEELQAIEECEIDLREEVRPLTDDELMEQLIEFPMNPLALDSNTGTPIFSNPKGLWEEMARVKLPLPSQEDVKLLNGDVVDAEFEVTDDANTEVSEKSKKSSRPNFGKDKKII